MLVSDTHLSTKNSFYGSGSLYSGRVSLCAESARSSISGTSRGSISGPSQRSRSSSVSLRFSAGANGDVLAGGGTRENYLLPSARRTSGASLASSAWGSFRMSVQNLSKAAMQVFLVTPFSRHRCCLGCVSLRDAVPLICVAELVVIGLCSLIAVDFYTTDGRMFYTKEVEGQGKAIAIGFTVFLAISIPVIVFTLAAWHFNKPYLYIIHILWQWSVLEAMLLFAYGILTRTFSAETRLRTGFLLPSAVVLSLTALVAIVVQSWWLFVFIDAMFFEMSRKQRRKNNSSKFIEQDDNCSIFTADSRRHSLAIPVVKVDRSKSVDTTSLGAPRKLTLTKMDEIPEVADV